MFLRIFLFAKIPLCPNFLCALCHGVSYVVGTLCRGTTVQAHTASHFLNLQGRSTRMISAWQYSHKSSTLQYYCGDYSTWPAPTEIPLALFCHLFLAGWRLAPVPQGWLGGFQLNRVLVYQLRVWGGCWGGGVESLWNTEHGTWNGTVCLGSTNKLCLGQRLKHVKPLEMT